MFSEMDNATDAPADQEINSDAVAVAHLKNHGEPSKFRPAAGAGFLSYAPKVRVDGVA